MFKDLLIELIEARTEEEKETVYRKLEKVGVDRFTADYLCEESKKWNKT